MIYLVLIVSALLVGLVGYLVGYSHGLNDPHTRLKMAFLREENAQLKFCVSLGRIDQKLKRTHP